MLDQQGQVILPRFLLCRALLLLLLLLLLVQALQRLPLLLIGLDQATAAWYSSRLQQARLPARTKCCLLEGFLTIRSRLCGPITPALKA